MARKASPGPSRPDGGRPSERWNEASVRKFLTMRAEGEQHQKIGDALVPTRSAQACRLLLLNCRKRAKEVERFWPTIDELMPAILAREAQVKQDAEERRSRKGPRPSRTTTALRNEGKSVTMVPVAAAVAEQPEPVQDAYDDKIQSQQTPHRQEGPLLMQPPPQMGFNQFLAQLVNGEEIQYDESWQREMIRLHQEDTDRQLNSETSLEQWCEERNIECSDGLRSLFWACMPDGTGSEVPQSQGLSGQQLAPHTSNAAIARASRERATYAQRHLPEPWLHKSARSARRRVVFTRSYAGISRHKPTPVAKSSRTAAARGAVQARDADAATSLTEDFAALRLLAEVASTREYITQ